MKNFLFGVILGIANIIPGVSGGTMAVILNIYDKILLALTIKTLKENGLFLLNLLAGSVAGILLFSNGITFLFDNYYMATNFSFIGLVVGSVPMIYNKGKFDKIENKNLIPFFIALFFMIGLAIVKIMPSALEGVFTVEQLSLVPKMVWLFISATISTIGMILPGISGSFLMLLLGAYKVTIEAIAEFDISILLPVGLGVITGGVAGVKIVKNLIKEHPQALYFGIMGLMIGSIFTIYPGFQMNGEGVFSICGFTLCALGSFMLSKIK